MSRLLASRVGVVCALLAPFAALADPDPLYGPTVLPPAQQMLEDATALPAGTGAVFVPRLTDHPDEGSVMILDARRTVRGQLGERIAVPPGEYVVLVGEGPPPRRIGTRVKIEVGRTTMVPVRWGALDLTPVDRRGRPLQDAVLEILDLEARTPVAPAGPITHPVLLPPGTYRIQAPGTLAGNTTFATVVVPADGVARARVAVDPVSGLVIGGGTVAPGEADAPVELAAGPWRGSLVLGADGSFSQSVRQVGVPNYASAAGSAFVHSEATFQQDQHALALKGDLDQGWTVLQPGTGTPLPPMKSTDRLAGEVLYSTLATSFLGPYAVLGGETRLLATPAITAADTTAVFEDLDGTRRTEAIPAADSYIIAPAFAPSVGRTGVGVQILASRARALDLSFRGGLGYRLYHFGGAYLPLDDPDTAALEHIQIDNFMGPGVEAVASATVRITGVLNWTTEADLFSGFGPIGVVTSWDNTLSLGLTRAVSLNYRLNLDHMPAVTPELRLQQGVFLRAAWNVL